MTKKTLARGAVIERDLVRRFLRRRLNEPSHTAGFYQALRDVQLWLKAQPARTAKPGGIGTR